MAKRRSGLANYLSSVRQRVSALNEERQALVGELQQMLSELTGAATPGKRRGRPAGKPGKKRGRRKGFKMSAEARKKMADAAKKRWAAKKAKS